MPIAIAKLAKEDSVDIFGRASISDEVLQPYIDTFKARGFEAGDIGRVDVTGDATMRQAKRRLNAAAQSCGYSLNWREKGDKLYFKVKSKDVESTQDAPAQPEAEKPAA
jgi:hypothetical protein